MTIYPLGMIMELVDSINVGTVPMKVAYAYEDLVFMEHNAFILQFTEIENELLLHTNVVAEEGELVNSILALKAAAKNKKIKIKEGSLYSLEQADADNISIKFVPKDQDV